ncbi:MAG: mismatch-specific DNA-glycosylase [Flammeovirgaceae bacterium]|nr:mismatch-specific DNA-glycosylase [Flammeovirgaceae bacterium]
MVNVILPDLLKEKLDIVFCGTAAGNKSAERKAYYAGAGNLFYATLASCCLTPRILKPNEFPELLNYQIGLTDLAKFTFGMDKDLKHEDYDAKGFEEKILIHQPKFVCFNGKTAASKYLGVTDTRLLSYGLNGVTINKTKLFIAPSTSPKAFAYWDESIWRQLKNLII